MKYVVTDEDIDKFNTVYEEAWTRAAEDHPYAKYGYADTFATRAALESFAQTLGEPAAVPDDELLQCALDANDMCRSAFQVVERVAIEYGTPFAGTNFGGLHEQLKKSLERQHKVLKPYREAMLSAAPHHPTTEKGCE